MTRATRLAKLEALKPWTMSEAVRAWLGQRPPLTKAEQAAHDFEKEQLAPPDWSGYSPELRKWLGLD